MDTDGSSRATPPPLLAVAGVLAGVAAMAATGALTAPLGLRVMLVCSELALAVPALIALGHPRWRASLGLRAVPVSLVLLGLASGAALWAASLGLLELQYTVWSPPPGYLQDFQRLHDMLRPHGVLDAALSVLAIAVAPGVCEELLFRGLVLPSLRARVGTAAAVAGSALLFGAIHLDFSGGGATLYRVPFAIAVGVGFALLRLRTGSLFPAMAAHALVNAVTFAAALQQPPSASVPPPQPWVGAGLLLAGLFAQAFLLIRFAPEASARSHAALDSL